MTGKSTESLASSHKVTEADWITEMKLHFRDTGQYRAGDLTKLLGDPREHRDIVVSTELPRNLMPKP